MFAKSIFKNCKYVQTTLNLDRVNENLPGDDYPLECYRTGFLNKISFMREMWVSDEAIPLLTIAKHLSNFSPCALWRNFHLTGKIFENNVSLCQQYWSTVKLWFYRRESLWAKLCDLSTDLRLWRFLQSLNHTTVRIRAGRNILSTSNSNQKPRKRFVS